MFVRVWLHRVCAVVVLGLLLSAFSVQAKGQSSTMRFAPSKEPGSVYSTSKLPVCQRSFDPYKVPRSFLKKCGVKTIPLAAVKPLPGGGKAYIFYDHGTKTIFPVPPKGFNTCKATDKQLAEYGLPPRSQGHTSGNGKCRPLHITPPGPYLVEGTMMLSGGRPSTGSADTAISSTSVSTSPVGSTSSTTSNPSSIPNTGGQPLLPYVAALFMAAGGVMLLVLRRRVR